MATQYQPTHPDPENAVNKPRKVGARFAPPLLWKIWGVIQYHHDGKPAEFVRAAFKFYLESLRGREIGYTVDGVNYLKPSGDDFPEHREKFSPGRY